ncbi:uncharacterized protein LOC124342465 isoform X2 [Daphnia pulicaria]|uniref:uncharacterized protein LOC124342465 isoform X2 n=1 Tax=Daphnia pulicaria TaxID=35523 RepID=UPI001EEA2B5F|nr:uncharacterized protein LOC124342465 isoform X2 [Daphnia pulicaria]
MWTCIAISSASAQTVRWRVTLYFQDWYMGLKLLLKLLSKLLLAATSASLQKFLRICTSAFLQEFLRICTNRWIDVLSIHFQDCYMIIRLLGDPELIKVKKGDLIQLKRHGFSFG